MSFLTANQIRNKFINYFQKNDHRAVHSASLVPFSEDKSLLFTNSGMVPFKNLFLGYEKRDYQRAVSIQRCLRAGGKHNDLDNVGYTARHHTFFEMLGNFSFGDYFKEKAIHLAWEFLTKELELPEEKLWITVHHSDDEAENIWHTQIGVPKEKIIRCGDEDNFWSMGSTGPCGPCSEIFYDHGEDVEGGPPGSPDEDGDRYVEIWNLVFMQFNRDAEGNLTPLPKPSVDTGMGLERIATVLQKKLNNYDTDELAILVSTAQSLTDFEDKENPSFKVLADHIRACAFLIADGVLPSNEGRGYVLRRIIRRAIRHGQKVGIEKSPFFDLLLAPLVECMGENYPELKKAEELIRDTLRREELRFSETLKKGLALFQQKITESENIKQGKNVDGELIFYLYDTFGFPVDLTADVAREMNLGMDYEGFEQAMEKQKQRARKAMQFDQAEVSLSIDPIDNFVAYEHTNCETKIYAIYRSDGQSISTVENKERVFVVLKKCPFYSESGGQVSDVGVLKSLKGEFAVNAMNKQGRTYICCGELLDGCLSVNDEVQAQVDVARRGRIEKNHSGTHLLHYALRNQLGTGVEQRGSLVDESKLRFDFSHSEKIPPETLLSIEGEINQMIMENHQVETQVLPIDEAKKIGAMALFGEKYGDEVRVVKIGNSVELCGGTHVAYSGNIGLIKVVSESSVSTGIRRIEALSGEAALSYHNQRSNLIEQLSLLCKVPETELPKYVGGLLDKQKKLKTQIDGLENTLNANKSASIEVQKIGKFNVIVQQFDDLEANKVRQRIDEYKQKVQSGIVIVATSSKNKGQLACGVTKDLLPVIKANDLVNRLATYADGKGGGREDMAMASAAPDKISFAFEQIEKILSDY
jgi:alanyl-tRNA synthetase